MIIGIVMDAKIIKVNVQKPIANFICYILILNCKLIGKNII